MIHLSLTFWKCALAAKLRSSLVVHRHDYDYFFSKWRGKEQRATLIRIYLSTSLFRERICEYIPYLGDRMHVPKHKILRKKPSDPERLAEGQKGLTIVPMIATASAMRC
jgi:hypothetical protein